MCLTAHHHFNKREKKKSQYRRHNFYRFIRLPFFLSFSMALFLCVANDSIFTSSIVVWSLPFINRPIESHLPPPSKSNYIWWRNNKIYAQQQQQFGTYANWPKTWSSRREKKKNEEDRKFNENCKLMSFTAMTNKNWWLTNRFQLYGIKAAAAHRDPTHTHALPRIYVVLARIFEMWFIATIISMLRCIFSSFFFYFITSFFSVFICFHTL